MLKNLVLSLLLLAAFSLSAQDYRPLFGSGDLLFPYKTDTGTQFDRIFHMRVDSVGTMGGDSAWFFSRISSSGGDEFYDLNLEHVMGAYQVARPAGIYEFHSLASGDTIFLRTQMPLNTPWNFLSGSSLTAQVTSRSLVNLFGTTPDSVLTISLSDNNEILLSQNHGLVSFPGPSAYFTGDSLIVYDLYKPAFRPTIRTFYGWDVGDYLGAYEIASYINGSYRHGNRILAASVSASGNAVDFTVDRLTVSNNGNYTRDTTTMHFDSLTHGHLLLGTGEYTNGGQGSIQLVNDDFYDSSGAWGRGISYLEGSGAVAAPGSQLESDVGSYRNNVGPTFFSQQGTIASNGYFADWSLECYLVGSDSLLPCTNLDSMIATSVELPAESGQIRVYPNPSEGEFLVEWENTSALPKAFLVHDLSGRLLWRRDARQRGSGKIEIDLNLPAGVYLLTVQQSDQSALHEKLIVH